MVAREGADGLPRMTTFVQPLWGFSMDLPAGWVHRSLQNGDAFARIEDALDPGYVGPLGGHIMVHAEWNGLHRAVEPIWREHVARVATMLGAKQVRSAPWRIGPGEGLEAEIALPKKEANRLWLGVLSHDMIMLKLLVAHPLACRAEFEPQATDVLRSLSFLESVPDLPQHPCGLPLPPDCTPQPTTEILEELGSQGSWEVFGTPHSMGAVQGFFWREARAAGWEITSFQPYPGDHPLPFARVGLHKAGRAIALGILPHHRQGADEGEPPAWLALHWR
jgi:hypothetical protein